MAEQPIPAIRRHEGRVALRRPKPVRAWENIGRLCFRQELLKAARSERLPRPEKEKREAGDGQGTRC